MAYAAAGYTVAELLTILGDGIGWKTPSGAQNTKMYQALTSAGLAASTWKGADWDWLHATSSFSTAGGSITATGLVRSTNVVTVTTSAAHGLSATYPHTVLIFGADSTTFHGSFAVASVPSTTTFTYAQTDSNESSGGGTASVYQYALRTINSAAMASLRTVERVYYEDDWHLEPMSYRDFKEWDRLDRPTAGATKPNWYMLTGTTPILWLKDMPNAVWTIYVDYIQRHSEIASGLDAELIVPEAFQDGVYRDGGLWWLRHETESMASWEDCPGFVEAMNRMQAAGRDSYDRKAVNLFPDAKGTLPHDRRVIRGLIQNDVSV